MDPELTMPKYLAMVIGEPARIDRAGNVGPLHQCNIEELDVDQGFKALLKNRKRQILLMARAQLGTLGQNHGRAMNQSSSESITPCELAP